MKLVFSMLFYLLAFAAWGQQKYYMLVGTYTSTGSEGIYVEAFNAKKGSSQRISTVKTSNPSFLTIASNKKFVYAVNENANASSNGGGITSFSFNKKNGTLSAIDSQSSIGNHPCYIALNASNKWIAAGNYSSGDFIIMPALENGKLGTATDTVKHKGSGPRKQQGSPHVHSTVFSADDKYLLVNDLGIDKIIVYKFNENTGTVSKHSETAVAPGSGPRHLAFHPTNQYVYILNELAGSINVFAFNKTEGSLTALQTISSVEENFTGVAGCADIHVSADGKFLYASNRGDANNIAMYSINKKDGKLTNIGFQPVMGKGPRNFSIAPGGKYLLVANQNTDEIVIFKRNKNTGLLTDSGKRISIPKPVCIQWIKR